MDLHARMASCDASAVMRKRCELQTHTHPSVDPRLLETLQATIAKICARSRVVGWRLVPESGPVEGRRRESLGEAMEKSAAPRTRAPVLLDSLWSWRPPVVHCWLSPGNSDYPTTPKILGPAVGLPPLDPGLCRRRRRFVSGVPPTTTSAHSGSAKWLSAANPSAILRGLPMEDLAPLPRGRPFRDRRRTSGVVSVVRICEQQHRAAFEDR